MRQLWLGLLVACGGTSSGGDAAVPPNCGDGVLDLADGEQCDDGGTAPGDGCSAACQFEPAGGTCGDGTVDTGEACDDANNANGDTCNPTCNFANTTSLFVGMPGMPGRIDGTGTTARVQRHGVLVADATHLYLGDSINRVVRKIEVATAEVTTIAGDGMLGVMDNADGLMARFVGIEAITTDGSTIWVADGGRRIRAISTTPPYAVTTVAGSNASTYAPGIGTQASFDDVRGLSYYAGKVYFVDSSAAVLGSFDPVTGEVVTLAGTPYQLGCPGTGGMPADGTGAAAVMCSPRYMTSDNRGKLFVADTNGNAMRVFDIATNHLGTFAGDGTCGYTEGTGAAAQIHRPRGMTSDGTSLYWAEHNAHTIRQGVIASAEVTTMLGTPVACALTCSCAATQMGGYAEGVGAQAQLSSPFSVAYHFPTRSLFFVDADNAVIRRVQ